MSSIFDGIRHFVWHLEICYFDACCTIFVLISYFFDTQATLILILIDVKYTQNAVFSFEKSSNYESDSCLGSHHAVEKSSLPAKCLIPTIPPPPPRPLTAIWKTLKYVLQLYVYTATFYGFHMLSKFVQSQCLRLNTFAKWLLLELW